MTMRLSTPGAVLRVGLVAGPLGAVLIARSFTPTPTAAAQYNIPSSPIPVAAAGPTLTPGQQRAAAWLDALPQSPKILSPMDHKPLKSADGDPDTALKLSAVFGTPGGGLATINGAIYRIGDRPAPNCRITQIDARLGTVEVVFDDGATATLGP